MCSTQVLAENSWHGTAGPLDPQLPFVFGMNVPVMPFQTDFAFRTAPCVTTRAVFAGARPHEVRDLELCVPSCLCRSQQEADCQHELWYPGVLLLSWDVNKVGEGDDGA